MRVVAIIQARMSSTRLPGKCLMEIQGKPMVQHVVERAQAIEGVDEVFLAVPSTDWLAFVMHPIGRLFFDSRVATEDVLGRFCYAAKSYDADIILRLTADCPLLAPEVCEAVLNPLIWRCQECGLRFDHITNDTTRSGYPDGLDCQAFTRELLEQAHREATDPADREHVCPWMERHARRMAIVGLDAKGAAPSIKLSVDTAEDLARVRRIMARIPAGDYSWAATQEAIRKEAAC